MKIFRQKIFPIYIVVTLAVFASIFFIVFYPSDSRVEIGDTMAYHTLASNIKQYRTFGERYQAAIPGLHLFHTMPSGEEISTTYRPPGYPAFLALLYLVSENYYFVAIFQSLLAILSLCFLYKLIRKYFSHKVALISLGLYSLLPAFYQLNVSFWSESFTQSILIISVYLFLTGRKIFLNLILPSLLLSWVMLSRPTYAIYLFVILLMIFINYLKHKSIDKWLLAIFIVTMIPIAIWSVRCSHVTKKPVFISSTTGINLFISNNPYVMNGRASTWPSAEYLTQNGIDISRNDYNDAILNQQMIKSGLKWIKENPWLFIELVPNRIVYFFAPITNNFLPKGLSGHLPNLFLGVIAIWSNLIFYFLLFFSIIGLWFFPRKKLLLWLLPYLAIIAITYPENRYFFPFVLPMSILAVYGFNGLKNIKKAKVAILVAIFLTYWQFNYFSPDLYRQVAMTSKSWSEYVDLVQFTRENSDNFFITSAVDGSKNTNVIVKRAPTGNEESFILVSNNKIVSEEEILSKIESGQMYTDLINPFSDLDKIRYPKITDQNNLIYEHFEKNAIFKLSNEIKIKSEENFLPRNSDRPNQTVYFNDLILEKGKTVQIRADFSSRGKVIICSLKNEYCFDLLSLADIDNFSVNVLVDTNKLPKRYSQYKLGLINYVNFPNPHNYNILFSGTRAYFTPNGTLIKDYDHN